MADGTTTLPRVGTDDAAGKGWLRPLLPFLGLGVIAVCLPLFSDSYWSVIASRACIYWVLVSGLNLVVGFGGQIAS